MVRHGRSKYSTSFRSSRSGLSAASRAIPVFSPGEIDVSVMAPPRLNPNNTLTHDSDIPAAPCAILPPVPELPEVDHIVRYVRPALVGRRIASARVVDRKG